MCDNFFSHITGFIDSIVNPNPCREFYGSLGEKFGEPWSWDSANTKPRAQAIYTSLTRFEELIAFSVLFNGLEPLKPLVMKLQKRNSDIYEAYQMIDKLITDIKYLRENINHEFDQGYELTRKMVVAVGSQESKPRTTVFPLTETISHQMISRTTGDELRCTCYG